MTAMATTEQGYLGIAEVALSTGLTPDTLRWYEREGLLPPVERDPNGRRRYGAWHLRLLRVLVRLRRTGMPTSEMRRFSRLVTTGTATHAERLELLSAHRDRIVTRIAMLEEELAVLDAKTAHYRHLIENGLDCGLAASEQGGTRP